jgi:hypothetical protein
MALEQILGSIPLDLPTSVLSQAVGTPLAVIHKDIKTATLAPKSPYSVIDDGVSANALKHCIIRNVKNLPWIELYPVISGSTLPGVALKGRLFGFCPDVRENASAHTNSPTIFHNGRRMPQDIDPTNFDDKLCGVIPNPSSSEDTLPKRETGHWLPLKALGASAPGLLTFNNAVVVDQTDTADGRLELHVLEPIICYAAGFRDILFTVETPLTLSTAAMLIARLTS